LVTRFATSPPTDNCPQLKEAQPLSQLDTRSISHFDSSALWFDGPEVSLNWLFPYPILPSSSVSPPIPSLSPNCRREPKPPDGWVVCVEVHTGPTRAAGGLPAGRHARDLRRGVAAARHGRAGPAGPPRPQLGPQLFCSASASAVRATHVPGGHAVGAAGTARAGAGQRSRRGHSLAALHARGAIFALGAPAAAAPHGTHQGAWAGSTAPMG
jgi:hypothetical protein